MGALALVKSEHFGEIEADIYSDGNEKFMTINQLAECLDYADRSGVQKIVLRNPYLNEPEFSGWDNLSLPQGGVQKTRVFTEDGIYEVTMLSGQQKAKEFRGWIRGVLKALRHGEVKLEIKASAEMALLEAQRNRSKAMLLNAQTRVYKAVTKVVDNKLLFTIHTDKSLLSKCAVTLIPQDF